jgi:hypothetical protein
MKYVEAYSHHNAEAEWQKRELFEWLTDVFAAPSIEIARKTSSVIRAHIRQQFDEEGWTSEVGIDQNFDLTVFSRKDDLAFQVQTGNISRAVYDLVKMQYLFNIKQIEAAALAVPSSSAATKLGSNIASFNRIMNELGLFSRVITVPVLLISFE